MTDGGGGMTKWENCLPQTCTDMSSQPAQQHGCMDYEEYSWCATAVSSEGLVKGWDVCQECSAETTSAAPEPVTTSTEGGGQVETITTTNVSEGGGQVETVTTTMPSQKSAEMGCGCNCGCKISAEYVMAIVSGDIEALVEMAGASQSQTGRSLDRRGRKKQQRPRLGVADLTAALGQSGLQLPVECGCDCSCEVQDVGPLLPAQPTKPAQSVGSKPPVSNSAATPTGGVSKPAVTTTGGVSEPAAVTTVGASEPASISPVGGSEPPTEESSESLPPISTTIEPGPPPDCYCGLAQRSKRIVGGSQTEVNEYPWQAAVITRSGGFCGGSLISDQWVLTAAHCTDGKSAGGVQVHLGQHDLYSATESKLLVMAVDKIVQHPSYNSQTTNFDFSLLKLSASIDFINNPHVRPVCLPKDLSHSYEGYLATVSGWGTTSSGGDMASKLREVDVNVMSNTDCKGMGYKPEWITSQMMCAGVVGGGKDSCQGDSGGPLVTSGSGSGSSPGENYELIGVVSWGDGCAEDAYPGVYARVTSQMDWIRGHLEDHGGRTCPRS